MGQSHLLPNATLGRKASANEFLSQRWYYANQQDLLLGILLAAAGNIVISIALNVQKCSHLRSLQQAIQKPYYRSKLWWCGFLLMGIGEVGNFIAYGFAPVVVIAPLGSVTFVGGAIIALLFLRENFRSECILGGTVMFAGIFLLVTFAPHVTQKVMARTIQNDLVSWKFLIYMIMEIITFCVLLYFYKRKEAKHVALLLTMVALLASLTIISVKAVAAMMILSVKGSMQLTYPVFYIMLILMAVSCVFQVKFLNKAAEIYGSAAIIPVNYIFCSISSIVAGAIFYQEFQGTGFLSGFMFFSGCSLMFVGVFITTRNRGKEHLTSFYIDYGHIPGKKRSSIVQPELNSQSYGSLCKEGASVKIQTRE